MATKVSFVAAGRRTPAPHPIPSHPTPTAYGIRHTAYGSGRSTLVPTRACPVPCVPSGPSLVRALIDRTDPGPSPRRPPSLALMHLCPPALCIYRRFDHAAGVESQWWLGRCHPRRVRAQGRRDQPGASSLGLRLLVSPGIFHLFFLQCFAWFPCLCICFPSLVSLDATTIFARGTLDTTHGWPSWSCRTSCPVGLPATRMRIRAAW